MKNKDNKQEDYECDPEYPCRCTESGIEGEWEWDEKQRIWICLGCGQTQ